MALREIEFKNDWLCEKECKKRVRKEQVQSNAPAMFFITSAVALMACSHSRLRLLLVLSQRRELCLIPESPQAPVTEQRFRRRLDLATLRLT